MKMSSNPWFGDWMYFFSNIFELAAIEAVIVGVMNIAGQLHE